MGELKTKLEERGLETSGKKAELIARLATAAEADGPTEDEVEFVKIADEFRGMKNAALQGLLGMNDQKKSGAKEEMVQRCADAKMWGCLPKCPECGGGGWT
eukprot:TRINITY_DN3458_c0_g1_i3.p2 TRINITY_DN3458_c0_g1~~TRINITY_DN3458_c0_g1_i3.p2  ORF type:complete len:101 (-),score=34.89 TRINITY_DN3458_c0_g1_i3:504-806(-)